MTVTRDTSRRYQAVIRSPFGRLGIQVGDGCVQTIDFLPSPGALKPPRDPLARAVAAQLRRYFRDPAWRFSVPLCEQGTDFQRRVWQAMARIRVGEIRSYGDLARELGSSPRAVGGACRANPVPVLVPCHRVVAARGVGGFAGKIRGREIEWKRRLLAHEGALERPTRGAAGGR